MIYILVQGLDRGKRVRLIDGRLTPVFEYRKQALNYARGKGMYNCVVKKIDLEYDFNNKKIKNED